MARRIVLLLCVLAGCSNPDKQPSTARPEAAPLDAATTAGWKLRYGAQYVASPGHPLREVAIASDGTISVLADKREIATRKLPASEVAPLGRLIASEEFRILQSFKADITADDAAVTELTVTAGDYALDARWPLVPDQAAPVLREVERLRALVAGPTHFLVSVTERTATGLNVMISSDGKVQVVRDIDLIGEAVLPAGALDRLRALLADPGTGALAATATTTLDEPGPIGISITGDLNVHAFYAGEVPAAARGLYDEVQRIGAAVAAAREPPVRFTVVYTRQEHGAALGPLRTVTIDPHWRAVVIEEEGQPRREKWLSRADITAFAALLVDPAFTLATPAPPSSEGVHHRIVVTGDVRLDVTYKVNVPAPVRALLDRIEQVAR